MLIIQVVCMILILIKKKILNEKCELNDFKNVHVMDGSVIKEGLYYPTLFLMMYIKHISKLIINNDKKD